MKRAFRHSNSPFSVFSCSVSVRVRLELALLERQELRPDLVLLRPQSRTACSGDMMPSVSVSASDPTLTEYSRWGRPISVLYAAIWGGTGSPKAMSLREKSVPDTTHKDTMRENTICIMHTRTDFNSKGLEDK